MYVCICLLNGHPLRPDNRQRGVYSVRSQAAPRALRTLVRVVGVSVEEQGVEVFVTQNQRKLWVCAQTCSLLPHLPLFSDSRFVFLSVCFVTSVLFQR